MSLADITDFSEALALLGLYEREVMTTGVMEYVVPPKVLAKPAQVPESVANPPNEQASSPPPANIPQDTPALPEATPASSPVNNTTINEGIIIVNGVHDSEDGNEPPSQIQRVDASQETLPLPTPGPSELELLLEEQQVEKLLFYLFVEEIEQTGDLGKLPVALQPNGKS
ncbi:hypothetical protein [Synechocystis sp. PCC 6714]|uniref:hypothetical protein n=1 Tax=Synechocystis sp. (strain PCC 6714) TaxID=1147 RepID=UPI000416E976|nr:hypothetical protein [Synechocystis sp. PCC 6714]AIE76103.1 hypothetical protein D082_40570 [Synechocystis sp. PCC 6714]